MKIIERKSDGVILQVANCAELPPGVSPEEVNTYNLPGWDWSLINLTGVDRTSANWVSDSLKWSGTTLVKK